MDELYSMFAGPGDLFFDVGAYIGDKTQIMLDIGASKVISVEPCPESIAALRERFGTDPRVEIVPKGLGAVDGSVKTLMYDKGAATLATFSDKSRKFGRYKQRLYAARAQVEVTTLDALIEQFGVPAFCKIDVEGWEFQVLSGLSQPLPALNYEYSVEFEDEALRCAELLRTLDNYWFNFGEGQRVNDFAFPGWWPGKPDAFFQQVHRVKCTDWKGLLWGDIYAWLRD